MKKPCKFLSDLHILMGLIKENDSSRPVSLIPLNQHLLKEPKMFYIKILDDSSWRKDSKWAQTR